LTENNKSSQDIDPRDQKKFVFHATPIRQLTVAVLRLILPLIMKREIHGADNLPLEGPVILAANHLTN
jgi:1-acyl-sn-glycerol-3-phosphate acyltransferase